MLPKMCFTLMCQVVDNPEKNTLDTSSHTSHIYREIHLVYLSMSSREDMILNRLEGIKKI